MSKVVTNPAYYLTPSSTINAVGTGYVVGNTLTLVGGVFITAAQIQILTVTAGGIATFSVITPGNYSILPNNPVSLSGGAGTGGQLTAYWLSASPGFTNIQLYGTNTAGVNPPAGSLTNLELFVDTATPKLLVGNASGTPVKLVGTLGRQDANAVTITGGTIDNTAIGTSTPSTVTATQLRNTAFTSAGIVQNDAFGLFLSVPALTTSVGGTGLSNPTGYLKYQGALSPIQNSQIPNSDLVNDAFSIGSTTIMLGGGTTALTGLVSVTVTRAPVDPLDLTTKQYVDSRVVPGSGTVTNFLLDASLTNAFAVATPTITPTLSIRTPVAPTGKYLDVTGNWSVPTLTGAVTNVTLTPPTGFQVFGGGTGNVALTLSYSGTIPASSLGANTPLASTYLQGDSTWQPIPAGGFVGVTATQTLTNKTLTSPTIGNGTLTGTLTIGGTTGISGQVLHSTGTGLEWANSGNGSVTSITVATPSLFTVSPPTITTSGTFTFAYGTGQVPPANLGTNTPLATTYLQGDGSWQPIPAGGFVGVTATQTLTNKTFTSPIFNSATDNNLTLTGTLTANGVVGTNGQVLQTTGTGVQWANIGTGTVTSVSTSSTATPLTLTTSVASPNPAITLAWGTGQIPVANIGSGTSATTTYLQGNASGSASWVTFPTIPNDPGGGFVGVTATQTLTNKTLTSPTVNTPTINTATIVGGTATRLREPFTAVTATANTLTVDVSASSLFYTSTLSGTTTLTVSNILTALPTAGQSLSFSVISLSATTTAFINAITVTGVTATTKWLTGAAPTSGAVIGDYDLYQFTVFNNSGGYFVLASKLVY